MQLRLLPIPNPSSLLTRSAELRSTVDGYSGGSAMHVLIILWTSVSQLGTVSSDLCLNYCRTRKGFPSWFGEIMLVLNY